MVWKHFKDAYSKDPTNRRSNSMVMFQKCNIQTIANARLLIEDPIVWKCFKDAILQI